MLVYISTNESFKKKLNHCINSTYGTINSNSLIAFNTCLSLVDFTCFKNFFVGSFFKSESKQSYYF